MERVAGASIQMFVVDINGKTFGLDRDSSDTVHMVKAMVEEKLNVPACLQRLFPEGGGG